MTTVGMTTVGMPGHGFTFPVGGIVRAYLNNSEFKQVTFLTTRTSTGSKVDVFRQSQPLTQSSDVTHAVRAVKNVKTHA
jgi:hypothetical protein